MSRRAVFCPTGCGSASFTGIRRGSVQQDFHVDEDTGEIVLTWANAEGGKALWLSCRECGHTWKSSWHLDVALFIEAR